MTKYLKLIWFAENPWTKYHAAVGINAQKTLCEIYRSTRAILPSEKWGVPRLRTHDAFAPQDKCHKCLAALRKHYGAEDIEKVKVE